MSVVISSLHVFKSFPGLMLIFCQFVDAASLYFENFKLDFVFEKMEISFEIPEQSLKTRLFFVKELNFFKSTKFFKFPNNLLKHELLEK